LILAKNLVGNNSGKDFMKVNLTDFENFKEGDKKIPYQVLAECKGDLVGIKYEQLMPLVLPYQNAENAFRVFLEILLQLMMEQGSFTSPTLVQMMQK
jgi:isoleucyl-tRNA synthetase